MNKTEFRGMEWHLLVPVFLLLLLSCKIVYDLHGIDRAIAQIGWVVLSVFAAFVVLGVHYRSLARISTVIYPIILLSLIAVLFTVPINGATSWFRFGRVSIQPSEFAKPALILMLALYLPFREFYKKFVGLLPPLAFMLIPFGLVLLQPDLGTAMVYLPIFLVVVLVAGARVRHIVLLLLIALALSPLFYANMKEHQRLRIAAFFNPARYSSSVGHHLEQSRIAIGAGGLTGYSPEDSEIDDPHMSFIVYAATDYAFAVAAEKFGFLGSIFVLGLYMWIVVGAYFLLARTRDPVGRIIIAGAAASLVAQACLHIGCNLQLIPFTGITLPFLSYGGSSVMSSAILIAMVLNVGMRRRLTFGEDVSPNSTRAN